MVKYKKGFNRPHCLGLEETQAWGIVEGRCHRCGRTDCKELFYLKKNGEVYAKVCYSCFVKLLRSGGYTSNFWYKTLIPKKKRRRKGNE